MTTVIAPRNLQDFADRVANFLSMGQYDAELIIDTDRDEEMSGWCAGDHEFVMIGINKNMPIETQKLTLAHEMVHAKQMFDGDLEVDFGVMRYEGVDLTDTPYREQPHEIEAYYLESIIYEECK